MPPGGSARDDSDVPHGQRIDRVDVVAHDLYEWKLDADRRRQDGRVAQPPRDRRGGGGYHEPVHGARELHRDLRIASYRESPHGARNGDGVHRVRTRVDGELAGVAAGNSQFYGVLRERRPEDGVGHVVRQEQSSVYVGQAHDVLGSGAGQVELLEHLARVLVESGQLVGLRATRPPRRQQLAVGGEDGSDGHVHRLETFEEGQRPGDLVDPLHRSERVGGIEHVPDTLYPDVTLRAQIEELAVAGEAADRVGQNRELLETLRNDRDREPFQLCAGHRIQPVEAGEYALDERRTERPVYLEGTHLVGHDP